jgi:hypothetical protein
MSDPNVTPYGKFYWCVLVDKALAESGEIYFNADGVETDQSGTFVACRVKDGVKEVILMVPAGMWKTVFAASIIDGHALGVDHWKEQIE